MFHLFFIQFEGGSILFYNHNAFLINLGLLSLSIPLPFWPWCTFESQTGRQTLRM